MLNNTINESTEFVHFPKEILTIMLTNTVRDCIISSHLSILLPNEDLFQNLNTAIYLLGVDASRVSPQLIAKFVRVLDKYRLSQLDSVKNSTLTKAAEQVIKEWNEIIIVFNIKNETYED